MKAESLDPAALAGHLKPITRAWFSDFSKLRNHFGVDWRDEKAIVEAARKRSPIEPPVADAIQAYLERLDAPAASMEALRKLRAGAVCVVAGQQPGVAGGPLYNACKAMTAIRLARRIEAKGLPAVPVFWNHSDDHNPADLGTVMLPDGGSVLRKVGADLPDDGRTLGGREIDAGRFISDLERLLPQTEHRAGVVAKLRRSLRTDLADGFAATLLQWFGGHGLVVLEPSHLDGPRARALFDRVVGEPTLVERAVGRRTERLREEGWQPALAGLVGTGLFEIREGKRRRLDGKPERGRLSAGVALRPVLQDVVLPVAAYVAGPNEIAYLAQLGDLYEALGVTMAAVVPRAGMTLVEPKVARAIEKLSIPPDGLLAGRDALLKRATAGAHQDLRDKAARLDPDLRAKLHELEAPLGEVDRGLVDLIRKTSEKTGKILGGFQERIEEACRNADQVTISQVDRVANHLTPAGELQERKFTPWYYLALAGPKLLDELMELVDPLAGSHLVVRL